MELLQNHLLVASSVTYTLGKTEVTPKLQNCPQCHYKNSVTSPVIVIQSRAAWLMVLDAVEQSPEDSSLNKQGAFSLNLVRWKMEKRPIYKYREVRHHHVLRHP